MKIKLSRTQWELVGKKAGWMKKAGSDWFVNREYTQNIANTLKTKGYKTEIIEDHIVTTSYPVSENKSIPLKIQVFQDEYSNGYVLIAYSGDNQIAMPDGDTAEEAINNLDIQIKMIFR